MSRLPVLYRLAAIVMTVSALGACSTTGSRDEPPAQPAVVQPGAAATTGTTPAPVELPRSKYGNPPFYEVYGVRYTVLPESTGYRQQGVASWYGKKFHGRRTSSGEPYDMYKMTAAHTTLPIPVNARVTNLENGKSVVVRINDRGPFAKDRLIDMSYAAAVELDMIRSGTARVEVVVLSEAFNDKPATAPAPAAASAPANAAPRVPAEKQKVAMYLQVGAFGGRENAQQLAERLGSSGIVNARVHVKPGESPPLYRVRIGPMFNIEDYDRMMQRVSMMQIKDTQLVIETIGLNTRQQEFSVASNR